MKRLLLFLLIVPLVTTIACDDVFEKKLDGKAVTVVAPVDGTTVTEGTVTFLWVPMEGASGYHITVVSPSFEAAAIVVADTLLVDDSVTVRRMFRQAFSAGDYQWSITAFNSAYSSAASIFDLHVVAPLPDTTSIPAQPEPTPDTTSASAPVRPGLILAPSEFQP